MQIMHILRYTCLGLLLTVASPAYALKVPLPVFFSWGGEQIIKVAEFPDTAQFKSGDGQHIDPGYKYKQITLFFTPIWNYDGEWCGYVGSSERYLKIDKSTLDAAANVAGITLPMTPSPSFWESYGGKLLWLGVVALILLAGTSGSKKRDDSDQPVRHSGDSAAKPTEQ